MVTQPLYRLIVNGTDVTASIAPTLISLQVTDNEKNESDELTITVSAKFKRPAYSDQIKVFLGDQQSQRFVGLFYVQKTSIRNNKELTITATGIDFSGELKERRHQRYEQVTLAGLASTIAQRHDLQVKSDITQPIIDVDQVDESDLNLLNRLAKEHGCIFNIKNATLYWMRRGIAPPAVTIDINQCSASEITHVSTTLYKSCKAIYQNTKLNQYVTVSVGSGKPEMTKQGHFKNDDEARILAQNALSRANQGTAQGSLTFSGRIVFAGSRLNLDDQAYVITRVEHTMDNNGWMTALEFNNNDSSDSSTNTS